MTIAKGIRFGTRLYNSSLTKVLVYVIIVFLFGNCGPNWHDYPVSKTVSVTITNIMINCHYPKTSGNTINWLLHWHINWNGQRSSDPVVHIYSREKSNTSANQTSITFDAEFPSDGSWYGWYFSIEGTQCSTCVITNDQTALCSPDQVPGGTKAGLPAFEAYSNAFNSAPTTSSITIDASQATQIHNISCGCVVPN